MYMALWQKHFNGLGRNFYQLNWPLVRSISTLAYPHDSNNITNVQFKPMTRKFKISSETVNFPFSVASSLRSPTFSIVRPIQGGHGHGGVQGQPHNFLDN